MSDETTLEERRASAPEQIDNASLPAGSPMYYYCKSCGHLSDTKPENWFRGLPKRYCAWCIARGYDKKGD